MEVSSYALESLREDADFALYRGRRDTEPHHIFVLAPSSKHPAQAALGRLERESSLRTRLDPDWAVKPLALVQEKGQTMHHEELAHMSRVAIMGEMAGALAHELNQPLTGMVNNASAGRRFIAEGREDLPKLDGLFEADVEDGRRAGEIIRGIRGMVRKGKEVRGRVDLNEVITGVLRFVRSDALEHQCVLVTEPDPDLPLVEANRVQIQQVLLNLVVNAFEAMRETPVPEQRAQIRRSRPGECARFWHWSARGRAGADF